MGVLQSLCQNPWGGKVLLTYLFIVKQKNFLCVLQLQSTIGHPQEEAPFNPYVLQRNRGITGAERGRQSNI